jgi:hypothetical protein
MTNGFKCSSKLINLILSKNNIGVSTSLSLSIIRVSFCILLFCTKVEFML